MGNRPTRDNIVEDLITATLPYPHSQRKAFQLIIPDNESAARN